ncbi:linker histone H1 and H5 family protein [Loa loa]|uniref:Linker histone H1 and H5 family protein n=1 Tax=Loa loa TaxID=7209 RepID=A0A1I7W5M4_LOALO|nr:linker histone H1 and H5 family protein [Loa loa]EFO21535.1 linker histone H1 and H5 family protein [Loa loa]
MPATEEVAAAPSAATGDNLALVLSSNTSASVTAPTGKTGKKRSNMMARMNVSIPTSKVLKSQAKSQHSHPPYGNMIKAALLATQDKKGSSRAAILKYIMQNFAVGENPTMVNAHLRMGLKRGVASGVLKQMKGTGASGSFRLVDAKSEPPKKVKKPAIAKSATAGDMKLLSPKKSMKKKSATKKVTAPKVSKPKAVSTKKASAASAGGTRKKKSVGRPKKAKPSAVKSKTTKKTATHARSKKAAA